MIQDFKDEVLASEPRYQIKDNTGNVINNNVVIEQVTELLQEGTPLNKATFSNLQGDLYTVDRYNKPVVTLEPFGIGLVQGDIIPKEWVEESTTKIVSNNGIEVVSSHYRDVSYALLNAFDGDASTSKYYDSGNDYNDDVYVDIIFPEPQKITKMKTYMRVTDRLSTTDDDNWDILIMGSKNGSDWTELYNISNAQTSLEEITLNNTDYYKYYRATTTFGTEAMALLIFEWQVSEYEGYTYGYVHNLSLPLTSYEAGKILRIQGGSYIGEPTEITHTDNVFPTSWTQVTTGTEYTSAEGYTLTADGYYDYNNLDYYADNISDGEVTTGWVPNASGNGVTIACPKPIKITKMKTRFYYSNSLYPSTFAIKGSKNGSDWVDLYTVAESQNGLRDAILNNVDYYFYYRVTAEGFSSSNRPELYEWQVSEWVEYVESLETTTFENPYLNINNLGAKQINGTIEAGEKYNLIYNGENFDLAEKDYVVGVYTGDGEYSKFIDLGFTPKGVIVASANNQMDANYSGFAVEGHPVFPSTANARKTVEVVNGGFNVYYYSNGVSTNATGSAYNPYRYIAFK